MGGVFFFYMAHALLCGELLLHTPCCFIWRGFPYISGAFFFFMQEVCFPCPILFHIRNLSYTPYASLCAEIF